ncbi:putative poly(ADP-ribose) glycohydrolase 1 [Iris pallida]|uniref:poly(ADP-ribose) glycohydrolase n=1 Tax=Iris pallida TaxID=29817 RepID=A0AAX6HLB0_IRIPA|nr:putative poly(ADP-ribose) glycohydrolase 1 [Iris pallida]
MEEKREDLASILPYLPLIRRSSSSLLFWPPKAQSSLKALSLGPDISRVDSGDLLADAIADLRHSSGLSSDHGRSFSSRAADGYALFFNELMSRADSRMWFGDVIPTLARLVLRLPSLLVEHYRNADNDINGRGITGFRLLNQQEPGIVFLGQELIAALLSCAFFCLFPTSNRGKKHLPTINFDQLFASLHPKGNNSQQEQKVKCLIHYFERICQCMPTGVVSFERKVLPFEQRSNYISYPEVDFWRTSAISLCPFEAFPSGLIEDQNYEALEVDFANEYLGGGALHRGCVQEEIRFMINPELIIGMLFMPSMRKNEAIEIVGVERFSHYMGYGSSFRFMGDYLDKKQLDSFGRRKTRIIAIDALYSPRRRQYEVEGLIREVNKAYCGFFYRSKYQCCQKNFQETSSSGTHFRHNGSEAFSETDRNIAIKDGSSSRHGNGDISLPFIEDYHTNYEICHENIGIATGNWGCGAFGGDPEIKSIIQWLAASQALRPFIHYYTFGEASMQRMEEVTRWILLHGWTVGDLWSMLVEYSSQRLNGNSNLWFFSWLLPEQAARSSDVHYMSE